MRLAVALLLVVIAAPGFAEPSARDFVQSIYAHYAGKDDKGVPFATDAQLKRVFAPPLVKLIERDRALASKRGDAPALDGDPFVDAQDWQLTGLSISVDEDGPRATGRVSFKNIDRQQTMTLALVKVQGQWRVSDVSGAEGSLVAFLKKATGSR
jgi:hypothetical protein